MGSMRRGRKALGAALGAAVLFAVFAGASVHAQSTRSDARLAPTGSPGAFSVHFPRRERRRGTGISLSPSRTRPYWACPGGLCSAIVDPVSRTSSRRFAPPEGGPLLEGSGELGGYDPTDLRSAYRIPTAGGSTQTVALVDADGDATAESDLAKYRERYGLPACTKANGCFRKVNEKGEEANYPGANRGWEGETSLDLDMVSAACSQCHIMLVQATTASVLNLAESENTAARLGATEISNSYGIPEEGCGSGHCEELNSAYNHAGVLIVASSGDSGYDNFYEKAASPSFPATSPHVLAVGGTSLRKAAGARGWSEEVWNEPKRELGTGSGCSLSQSKPSWQKDNGCSHRTDNDVAAVAACETPLSVYSTAYSGWEDFCGTSAASPLVTGILAHAGEHTRSLGAQAFYEDRAALFGVPSGSNGTCTIEYLCNAARQEGGYDGPAGVGTPDGLPSPAPTVTAVAPYTGLPAGGTAVAITGTGFEEVTGVRFGSAAAKSFTVHSSGSISAVSPAGSATVDVTVETTAGTSATSAADRFTYFTTPRYSLAIGPEALGGVPSGVAADAAGDVWVSEFSKPTVKEFTAAGALVRELPSTLEAPCSGTRSESVGIAIDTKGDVWLTDRGRGRVYEFSPEGRCELEVGSVGEAAGQFRDPQGIAIGPGGKVWVLDAGNARVQELSETGQFLRQFGDGAPSAADPWGIAVDAKGHVWVSAMNALGSGVSEFGEAGEALGYLVSAEPTEGLFEWAGGLAVSPAGELFVAYFQPSRVEAFREGAQLVGRFGSCCSGSGGLLGWPVAVATDPLGDVWIAEMNSGRVEKWVGSP